jgi:hypothetical protein
MFFALLRYYCYALFSTIATHIRKTAYTSRNFSSFGFVPHNFSRTNPIGVLFQLPRFIMITHRLTALLQQHTVEFGSAEPQCAYAQVPEYGMLSLVARQKEICPVRVQDN